MFSFKICLAFFLLFIKAKIWADNIYLFETKTESPIFNSEKQNAKPVSTLKKGERISAFFFENGKIGFYRPNSLLPFWISSKNVSPSMQAWDQLIKLGLIEIEAVIKTSTNPYLWPENESIKNFSTKLEAGSKVQILAQKGPFLKIKNQKEILGWVLPSMIHRITIVESPGLTEQEIFNPVPDPKFSQKVYDIKGQCFNSEININNFTIPLPFAVSVLKNVENTEKKSISYELSFQQRQVEKKLKTWIFETRNSGKNVVVQSGANLLPKVIQFETYVRSQIYGRLILEFEDGSRFEESFKPLQIDAEFDPKVFFESSCETIEFLWALEYKEKIAIRRDLSFQVYFQELPQKMNAVFQDGSRLDGLNLRSIFQIKPPTALSSSEFKQLNLDNSDLELSAKSELRLDFKQSWKILKRAKNMGLTSPQLGLALFWQAQDFFWINIEANKSLSLGEGHFFEYSSNQQGLELGFKFGSQANLLMIGLMGKHVALFENQSLLLGPSSQQIFLDNFLFGGKLHYRWNLGDELYALAKVTLAKSEKNLPIFGELGFQNRYAGQIMGLEIIFQYWKADLQELGFLWSLNFDLTQ